jgi:hypothetical protein
MCWFCAALSAAGVLESVICSCLVAELAGIGFFLFDRIFRTLATRHRPLNHKGLAIALQRYKLTMSLDSRRGESTRAREAAFQ